MHVMDKIWQYYGLARLPGEAGDRVLEVQFRHLKKSIPWLYLVMTFDIFSCIYAVTDSSSIILRIVIPIIVSIAMLSRMLLWFRRRNETFDAKSALKLLRSVAIASAIIGSLCALWSVLAWQSETSSFRYYIPAFMALGAFSTAYCLSLVPRSAILNVAIGVVPICTLLFTSGLMIDFALGATMIASTLFLTGLVRRQYRIMVQMIDLQLEMHDMAHTDPLTKLYNRRAFHEQLEQALELRRSEHGITLAMFDLDGFKQINDRYGHLAGDRVLQIAANRLNGIFSEFAKVSRLGGDEFAVLFEGQPPAFCNHLVEAAIQRLQKPTVVRGDHLNVGASFGLTSVDRDDQIQAIALISQTDLLLYQMKKQKSGSIHQSDSSSGAASRKHKARYIANS